MPHEFLSIYPAKLMEYCLAIGYLLLFVPFWRYVRVGRAEAPAVRAAAPARGARARGRLRARSGPVGRAVAGACLPT